MEKIYQQYRIVGFGGGSRDTKKDYLFEFDINDLEANKLYLVQSFVEYNKNKYYSVESSFQTSLALHEPCSVVLINEIYAMISCNVINNYNYYDNLKYCIFLNNRHYFRNSQQSCMSAHVDQKIYSLRRIFEISRDTDYEYSIQISDETNHDSIKSSKFTFTFKT